MTDRDRTVSIVIQKIDPVRYIVRNVHVIENPVPARLVGPQSVTVTALVLAVTMMRDKPRISFSTAAISDAGILKGDGAVV